MNEQLEFLKLVVGRLDAAGIPYMLTGSMAMSVYAVPRMTRDVDLVVECRPGDTDRIVSLFREDCYIDESRVREAIRTGGVFHVIHNEWIIKADMIVRKDEPFRREEFGRRTRLQMDGWELWVVSAEDLLLSKLMWARDSESDLQLRDARQIAESGEPLDWSYISRWASTPGLSEFVDKVRPT